MWSDLALNGGLSALRAGIGYMEAKKDAEAKQAWQNYKNDMTRISGAIQQGIINRNETRANENSVRQGFAISRSEYLTAAQAEVSAAAAGTGGRSPNDVLFDIHRNAADAQAQRQRDLEDQYAQFDNQREQTAMQVATQIDYSPIPQPNPATYALNFATDVTKLYKSSQPK